MSKKQTTNTFGKGMMLDLHPLTVPNDVLTDALNATTITMNGNEGILQNDMGNGRVESAFLPPGYVPVGIKEYGGIIYVASYNPITNKSQIGSFPSPERNIDQTEDNDLETPLNLLEGKYTRTYKFNEFNKPVYRLGLSGLTNKVEIFGRNKIIRSGDKFGFYFKGNQNDNTLLSNYFSFNKDNDERTGNNNNGTIYQVGGWDAENKTYQNNLVTLSVQVLDSNNNLRDLTHQLKRYESNHKPIEFADESEDDKFNAGYFIDGTLEDNDESPVNQERNKSALNTYNNKLFGKLYLVGQVNVVNHIDVQLVTKSYADQSLVAFNNSLKDYTESNILYFYIDYYYNFPNQYLYKPNLCIYYNNRFNQVDGIFEKFKDTSINNISKITKNISSGNIISIELCERSNTISHQTCNQIPQINPNYNRIKNYKSNGGIVLDTIEDNDNITESIFIPENIEEPIYDPLTNLYRKRYIAYIILDDDYSLENTDNTVLNYIIIPQMKNIPGEINSDDNGCYKDDNNNIISKLTHIAYEGSIDLSKIGSGECNITTWRYICTDNMVKLNWGLEDYSLDTDVITDMRMDFYDLNSKDPSDISNDNLDWYLTFNQINYNSVNTSITFSDDTLKKRHIYLVKLSRKKNGNSESIGWRILITTSIYNDLFMIHNDYCYYNKLNDDTLDDETELLLDHINERNIINLDIDIKLTNKIKTQSTYNNQIHKQIVKQKKQDNITYYYKKDLNSINKPGYETVHLSSDPTNIDYHYITLCEINNPSHYEDIIPDEEYEEVYNYSIIQENLSQDIYSIIRYTNFKVRKDLNYKISIPEKYPFEIDSLKSLIVSHEDEIIKNINGSLVGTQELPITNNNVIINNTKLESDSNLYDGTQNVILDSEYNFPSQLIFTYKDTLTTIRSKYSYSSMQEFIEGELPNKVIVPIIGHSDSDYHFFELITYDLAGEKIDRVFKKPLFKDDMREDRIKNITLYKNKINELLNEIGLTDSTFILLGSPITFGLHWNDSNSKNLQEIFQYIIHKVNESSSELNLQYDDTEYELYGEENDLTGSFMLRRSQYPYHENNTIEQYAIHAREGANNASPYEQNSDKKWFEMGEPNMFDNNINKSVWGHKDWFILLWKNKDDEFTIVNKFYALDEEVGPYIENKQNVTNSYFHPNIKSIIDLASDNNWAYKNHISDRSEIYSWISEAIFGDFGKKAFFKINQMDSVSGYIADEDTCAYNIDYSTQIKDIIVFSNIIINKLKYFDSNETSDIQDNTIAINIQHDNLDKFLDFNINNEQKKVPLDEDIYTISGMQSLLDNIFNIDIEGLIKYNGMFYTFDESGFPLTENFYIIQDNKPVTSNNVSDLNHREFLQRLTIRDNKLLVSNYNKSTSDYYAFSLGDRPINSGPKGGKLAIKIGAYVPYIKFKNQDDSQTSMIFPDYT